MNIYSQIELPIDSWSISVNGETWQTHQDIGNLNNGVENDKYKYVWTKIEFDIDIDKLDSITVLEIPYIFMIDETFINGVKVGDFSKERFSSFEEPRFYYIPPKLLTELDNVLMIKVGYYYKWSGEIGIPIVLHTDESYYDANRISIIKTKIIPLGILILLLSIASMFFIRFIWNRSNKDYLVIFFRLLIGAACYFSIFSPVQIFKNISVLQNFWIFLMFLYLFQLWLFIQTLYKKYFPIISLITLLIILSWLILLFSSEGGLEEKQLFDIIGITLNILFCIFLTITTIMFNKSGSNTIIFLHFSIDFILFLVCLISVVSFIVFDNVGVDPSFVVLIVTISIIVNLTIYYSRKERSNKNELVSLKETLQRLSSKNSGVSQEMQNKINTLLIYIDSNITKPLYRDTLAESLGLSPSYFSTIFNQVTGENLANYISNRRVIMAKELLSESDKSIIDIAFLTGFESVATFNRHFKKLLSCSPGEYRKREKSSR